jgi:hypothetical protein
MRGTDRAAVHQFLRNIGRWAGSPVLAACVIEMRMRVTR